MARAPYFIFCIAELQAILGLKRRILQLPLCLILSRSLCGADDAAANNGSGNEADFPGGVMINPLGDSGTTEQSFYGRTSTTTTTFRSPTTPQTTRGTTTTTRRTTISTRRPTTNRRPTASRRPTSTKSSATTQMITTAIRPTSIPTTTTTMRPRPTSTSVSSCKYN